MPRQRVEANIAAIRLLKELQREGRAATATEKSQLARYSGWGGLPTVFESHSPYSTPDWLREGKSQLQALLSTDEYESARKSVLNAHYTGVSLIDALWRGARALGFTGGRVLEPGCGIGSFFGRLPEAIENPVQLVGVEQDPLSAAIAQLIYPETQIQAQGFEQMRLPNGFFDLAIGNVPFGDYKLHDPEYARHNLLIHDYFIIKTLDKLKPGGIAALITSAGTLDKVGQKARLMMHERAVMAGAIRLPEDAHKAQAGTEVVSDILFFVKRARAPQPDDWPDWLDTEEVRLPFHAYPSQINSYAINKHFARTPTAVLGTMVAKSAQHGLRPTVLRADYYETRLITATQRLRRPESVEAAAPAVEPPSLLQMLEAFASDGVGEGSFIVDGSEKVHTVAMDETGVLRQRPAAGLGARDIERVRGMIAVRDRMMDVFRSQTQSDDPKEHEGARNALNAAYDVFVAKQGALNLAVNRRLFVQDPLFGRLMALEHFDNEKQIATKADIFYRPVLRRTEETSRYDAPADALAAVLNRLGRIDLDEVARLCEDDAFVVGRSLSRDGLTYLNPETGEWETATRYLSGNVLEKLEVARAANTLSPGIYDNNISALAAVQPAPLEPSQIDWRIGAAWIPAQDIADFINTTFNRHNTLHNATVTHYPNEGTWNVQGASIAKGSAAATTEYGTDKRDAIDIITRLLNGQSLAVYNTYTRMQDGAATLAAQTKADLIQEAFRRWVFDDQDRLQRLVSLYNSKFNIYVEPRYDGSHLTFPGMSLSFSMRSVQKNAVWRAIQEGNALFAHEVGVGKTAELIATAMEMRRLGLAHRPLVAVPNNILEQFERESRQIYPLARILVLSKDELNRMDRSEFLGRAANNEWDVLVVTHRMFERLAIDPEAEDRIYRGLLIDEFHNYKNLAIDDRSSDVSETINGSMRADDLYIKTRWLYQKRGSISGLVAASGTPIANSLLEFYNTQRYLQPQVLEAAGLSHFTAWRSVFLEPKTEWEPDPAGKGFYLRTRYALTNADDLMAMWRLVADVATADDAGIKRPDLETINIDSPMSPAQAVKREELAQRALRIRTEKVKPEQDNLLKIVSEGRKVALDARLIDPNAEDFSQGKLWSAVRNMLHEYHDSHNQKGVQLVFCDLGVPNGTNWSVYKELRDKLIDNGVLAGEIAFIHDAKNDRAIGQMLAAVRAGTIRFLFGSTAKMGEGTNAQDRVIAIHNIDPPWRPKDIEQRIGRGQRQGNMFSSVRNYIYTTNGSFDMFMWNTMNIKHRNFASLIKGRSGIRKFDLSADPTYAETVALCTDNPLIKEKLEVSTAISKLEALRRAHMDEQWRLRVKMGHQRARISEFNDAIAFGQSLLDERDTKTATQEWTLDLRPYGYDSEFSGQGEKMLPVLRKLMETCELERVDTLRYRGIAVSVSHKKGERMLWNLGKQTSEHGWFLRRRDLEASITELESIVAQRRSTLSGTENELAELERQHQRTNTFG